MKLIVMLVAVATGGVGAFLIVRGRLEPSVEDAYAQLVTAVAHSQLPRPAQDELLEDIAREKQRREV